MPAVTPQRDITPAVGALITADSSNGAIPTPEATSVSRVLEPEVDNVP